MAQEQGIGAEQSRIWTKEDSKHLADRKAHYKPWRHFVVLIQLFCCVLDPLLLYLKKI